MIDGAALDRYITGNYGQDDPSMMEPECEECEDTNLHDDDEWVCPHDYDLVMCKAIDAGDALYDRRRDHGEE